MVYLIRSTASGLHKIGITKNWQRRKKELEVGSKTVLVQHARVLNPAHLERSLHRRYAAARLPQSEWFSLSDSQVTEVIGVLRAATAACDEQLQVMKAKASALRDAEPKASMDPMPNWKFCLILFTPFGLLYGLLLLLAHAPFVGIPLVILLALAFFSIKPKS